MAARTNTDGGLPTYRVTEIPDGLATKTMLARQRRRPAPGQPAAAILFYHGNKHTPLYTVAAAQPLPPLPPGRQAAWTAARTCARCAATNETPYQSIENGRRLCLDCVVAERAAAVWPSWLRLRAAAVSWARDVLIDPDTVLLAAYRLTDWDGPIHVHAATVGGQVLVDVVARSRYDPLWRRPLGPAGSVNADDLVPLLMPLVGRRLVHTIRSNSGHYADHLTPLGELSTLSRRWYGEPSLRDPSIRQQPDDAFARRWTDWHNRPYQYGPHTRPSYGRFGLRTVNVDGGDAAEVTAAIRAGLARMALDDHPDGPATCPWLPAAGRTACGSPDIAQTGLCPAHRPGDAG